MDINEVVFVKEGVTFKKLRIKDLIFIRAFNNYLELQFDNQETAVIRNTLQNFMDILPTSHFLRIHRSYIVNIHKIEEIKPNTISIQAHTIPMSRTYKDQLFEQFTFFR